MSFPVLTSSSPSMGRSCPRRVPILPNRRSNCEAQLVPRAVVRQVQYCDHADLASAKCSPRWMAWHSSQYGPVPQSPQTSRSALGRPVGSPHSMQYSILGPATPARQFSIPLRSRSLDCDPPVGLVPGPKGLDRDGRVAGLGDVNSVTSVPQASHGLEWYTDFDLSIGTVVHSLRSTPIPPV